MSDKIELHIPSKIKKALLKEAADANISLNAHILKKLERTTPPIEHIDLDVLQNGLPYLIKYLEQLPGVHVMSSKITNDAYWWIKITIDIKNEFAWNVIQELAFVLNYVSISEPLPTVFKPVSPPPYLNGGPSDFLSWAIESTYNYIDPKWIQETLENRLPKIEEMKSSWSDS